MRRWLCLAITTTLLSSASVDAQTTVINAPPDPIPYSIGSNTQLNIGEGASTGTLLAGAENVWSVNIEVNINGGQLSKVYGYRGSVVNVMGGSITSGFDASPGATVNVSGGSLGPSTARFATVSLSGGSLLLSANQGTTVNVTGGELRGEWTGLTPAVKAQGATINLSGGKIGDDYRAASTKLNVTGGEIGESAWVESGSTLTMSGGSIGQEFQFSSATVNMSGGQIANGFLGGHTTFNLAGGVLGQGQINSESTFNMTGGVVAGRLQLFDSTGHISGGSISDGLYVSRAYYDQTSTMRISGRDFRVDGVPLNVASTLTYNLGLSVLSGTLADGTPFAFTGWDGDDIDDGMLILALASAPPIAPGTIWASMSPGRLGVRQGQTLLVDAGGVVGHVFNAGYGSSVVIEPGGAVGNNFEAVGASVTMTGGTLGDRSDLFSGSTMNLSGGTVGDGFDVYKSTLNITGGQIGDDLRILTDGVWNMSAGVVGNDAETSGVSLISGGEIGDDFQVHGVTTINGGKMGDRFYTSSDELTIAGGTFGDAFETRYSADPTIEGTDFRINGVPVDGLGQVGDSIVVRVYSSDLLTCVLADGTPFAVGDDLDNLHGDLVLKQAAASAPGPSFVLASAGPLPLGVRHGQTLVVDSGSDVPRDFSAAGATLVILPGGSVGRNLELIDSTAVLAGGEVGDHLDLFQNSTLIMSSGLIGESMEVHAGATFTLADGTVGDYLRVKQGGTVNVSGGQIGSVIEGHAGSMSVDQGGAFNVSGGELGTASTSGEMRVSGGLVAGVVVKQGGSLEITGGEISGTVTAYNASTVTMAGGRIGDDFTAWSMSTVAISGGAIGDRVKASGDVMITGGEFRLNGELISGLEQPGNELPLDLPDEYLLTGVLADGTPVAFSSADAEIYSSSGPGDQFLGSLTLKAAALPAVVGAELRTSEVGDVLGVREGQRLIVDGAVGRNLSAGRGSVVVVEEVGSVGPNFEAVGAEVTIAGGTVGNGMDAYAGTHVTMTGGTLGEGFQAFEGAVFDQSGGTAGYMKGFAGSQVNISGGATQTVEMMPGTSLTLSGGELQYVETDGHMQMMGGSVDFLASYDSGQFEIAGGGLGDGFRIYTGGSLVLEGADFRLDGVPIEGLENPGDELPIDVAGKSFTGVLADGTPFAMSRFGGHREIYSGVLRIRAATVAPVGPAQIIASQDPVPHGIREGQTLVVDSGGRTPANFTAGRGSTVMILAGGVAGRNLEAIYANVRLDGGTVDGPLDGFEESHIEIAGGAAGSVGVFNGSTFHMSGGSIAKVMLDDHATAEISGGEVGRESYVYSGSVLKMTGGTLGFESRVYEGRLDVHGGAVSSRLKVNSHSVLNLSGGAIGYGLQVDGTSKLNILGAEFAVNGVPVALLPGVPKFINDRNTYLTGVLTDGTPFSFFLDTRFANAYDYYFPSSAKITVTLATAAGDFNGDGLVGGADFLRWQREFGKSVPPGSGADSNRDGVVDAEDLKVWQAAYGSLNALKAIRASVPEPSGLTLVICLAALSLLGLRPGPSR